MTSNDDYNYGIEDYKIEKYQHKFKNTSIGDKQLIYLHKLNYYNIIGGANKHNDTIHLKPYRSTHEGYDPNDHINDKKKIETIGYGMMVKNDYSLEPVKFDRMVPDIHYVVIEILYTGICHSDVHDILGEWYADIPLVPGHEIVGKIVRKGKNANKFKMNDIVGVGPYINSCRRCNRCKDGNEQYCENGVSMVYNGNERKITDKNEPTGPKTYGGFSNIIVVHQDYVFMMPTNLRIENMAPLLCAGTTTWTPLAQFGVNENHTVGIIGLGGLGHMAIKFAKAMGAKVVGITRTEWKVHDGKRLGASKVIMSTDKDQMDKNRETLDFIIDTIPVVHDLTPYIDLLNFRGTLCIVGIFDKETFDSDDLATENRSIKGSIIGGIPDIKKMLEFCSEYVIEPDVEIIKMSDVNKTYKNIIHSKVKYRYVIDINSMYKK